MLQWLLENYGTILVSLVLIGLVIAITIYLTRQKKQGKSSCGAGCAHCAMAGQCHENRQTQV